MREDGWYHIKLGNSWIIAEFKDGGWHIPTFGYEIYDKIVQQIDERRIVREVE